ncbi:MAG: hypothetical protein KIT33_06925 [Candidatus Kapabacteria bacterium]|nr:hypothetical protein [Ignavibacteriota bacterium]MCW5884688.1 hypothetical protein [Candidatus Kapabacteria bacterium]
MIFIVLSFQNTELFGQTANPNYDSTLAKQLKADDYGMKSYFFVILKTGTNKTDDKKFIDSCFRGHLNNINKLVLEKKLIVAGPLGKNDNSYRGIFIFDLENLSEVESSLKDDPAISNKLLDADIYKWYGSAALPEYLKSSDSIWKVKP